MTLVKWKPNHMETYGDLDKMIETMFNPDWNFQSHKKRQWTPAVDVEEKSNSFIITADIAGLTKKEIKVSVCDKLLTISGKRDEKTNDSGDYYHYRERSTGTFHRSFNIPDSVNQDKIKANFKNGILIVELEKQEKKLPQEKEIKIS